MSMTEIQELVRELMALWSLQGATIASHLQPGVTADQLDRAELELGFPLSSEVRDWYTSHNGYTNPPPSTSIRSARWPNGHLPGSLEEAVPDHHTSLTLAAEANDEDDDQDHAIIFGAAWVTLTRPSKLSLAADCTTASTDRQAPSGLHKVNWWGQPEDWHDVVLPSVTSLLQAWLVLTQSGAIRYDTNMEQWDVDAAGIPPELNLPGVIIF